MTSDLSELLARVEAATGPDRELGDDVLFATGHRFSLAFLSGTGWRWKGADLTQREVPVTASLDAALALVERVLPGFTIDVTKYRENGGEFKPSALARLFNPYGEIREYAAKAATPALALLTALLRALKEQESGE